MSSSQQILPGALGGAGPRGCAVGAGVVAQILDAFQRRPAPDAAAEAAVAALPAALPAARRAAKSAARAAMAAAAEAAVAAGKPEPAKKDLVAIGDEAGDAAFAAAGAARRQLEAAVAARAVADTSVVHGVLLGVKHGGVFTVTECFALPAPRPEASAAAVEGGPAFAASAADKAEAAAAAAAAAAAGGEDGGADAAAAEGANDQEEGEDYGLNQGYVWKMLDLQRRVNTRLVALGWFSVGNYGLDAPDEAAAVAARGPTPAPLSEQAAKLYKFFAWQMRRAPVNLVVDASLVSGRVALRAYAGNSIGLAGRRAGTQFLRIPVEYAITAEENACAQALLRGVTAAEGAAADDQEVGLAELPGEIDALVAALKQVRTIVAELQGYADAAAANPDGADPAVGRRIADALTSLPAFDPEQSARLTAAHAQDAIMVVYLANMVRAQVLLAEKLARVVVDGTTPAASAPAAAAAAASAAPTTVDA